jgi:general secretion pathway protein C
MAGDRLFDLLNLVLIATAAYFGVNAFYSAMLPVMPTAAEYRPLWQAEEKRDSQIKRPLSAYRTIAERDLFGSRTTEPVKPRSIDPESMEKTDLDLKLWGTVNGGAGRSFAVIEDPTQRSGRKRQHLYQTGDKIQNATLVKILRNKIILDVDGRNEVLAIEDFRSAAKRRYVARRSPPRSPVKHRRYLRRKTVERATRDLGRMLDGLRVRPHNNGIMLSQVSPRSLLRRMGLRRGDIISRVDGRQIHSADDIVSAYNSLLTSATFTIEYIRRGRKRITEFILRN